MREKERKRIPCGNADETRSGDEIWPPGGFRRRVGGDDDGIKKVGRRWPERASNVSELSTVSVLASVSVSVSVSVCRGCHARWLLAAGCEGGGGRRARWTVCLSRSCSHHTAIECV